MLVNKWYTTNNKIVESKIPPLQEISLPIDDLIITASPFKIGIVDIKGDLKNKDINRFLQQCNYTNQLLYVVSNQFFEAILNQFLRINQVLPTIIKIKT